MALGERLRTGLLHNNDQTVQDDVINPFGGVGASRQRHEHRRQTGRSSPSGSG
jgi:hypothetical protein